jgi:hypothetical protein
MREKRLITLLIIYAAVTAALLFSTQPISAQNQQSGRGDREEPPPPLHNPYPPGILPANLNSEIARVLRKIDVIEGRAIERWHSLPLPTRLETRPARIRPSLKIPELNQ